MAGKLTVFTGGMFAEKSTNLLREGKRHLYAGKKVVFIKPAIDNRYSKDKIVTHDGQEIDSLNVHFDSEKGFMELFHKWTEVQEADVVCIDEVQFFPKSILGKINYLIQKGKLVYVSGLDMDRFGQPFETTKELMVRAEEVLKFHAVCRFCGEDAWVTIGTEKLDNDNQVNIGNDYIPACRTCAEEKAGVK